MGVLRIKVFWYNLFVNFQIHKITFSCWCNKCFGLESEGNLKELWISVFFTYQPSQVNVWMQQQRTEAWIQFSSISHVQLFATPLTTACQASLPITSSRSLLKLMSIELWWHPAISSSIVLFSFCLQSFPASGAFPMSQFFASVGQSIVASASASWSKKTCKRLVIF